jgi:ubiquinone/menaquinone biosynthesis C-methylase UbiE
MSNIAERDICPWWVGYLLASPLRRIVHDPVRILAPHIAEGMTVLEPGPGMGFFTLDIARLVGPSGRVVAVDVQEKMIEGLKRRARKAKLLDRIDARLIPSASLVLEDSRETIDFALAFAVVHETPSATRFFADAARAMKANATLLFAEFESHVPKMKFDRLLSAAVANGLTVVDHPVVDGCHTAILKKEA